MRELHNQTLISKEGKIKRTTQAAAQANNDKGSSGQASGAIPQTGHDRVTVSQGPAQAAASAVTSGGNLRTVPIMHLTKTKKGDGSIGYLPSQTSKRGPPPALLSMPAPKSSPQEKPGQRQSDQWQRR